MAENNWSSFAESKSPAFARFARAKFGSEGFQLIEELMREAEANEALEQKAIKRPSGASFNPFPVRIGHILAQSGCEPSLIEIEACFGVLCPHTNLISSAARELVQRALDITNECRNLSTQAVPIQTVPIQAVPIQAVRFALAIELDRVRHLHMNYLAAPSERESILTGARRLCELGGEINKGSPTPSIEYLVSTLASSIERYGRYHGGGRED